MGIESEVKIELSKEEKQVLGRLAYWTNKDQAYSCGDCGSFCSGGSCTTCTGIDNHELKDMPGFYLVEKAKRMTKLN